MHEDVNDTWLRRFGPPLEGGVRLICFPHAGGAASAYVSLARALAPDVEVLAVQYPGRQDRRHEPPVEDVDRLADLVAEALPTESGRPYALFGHSMGSVVAYETALRLARDGRRGPSRFFASGRGAPSLGPGRSDGLRGDAALTAEIRRLGGSRGVLDDPELMAMILPALRSDYRALGSYSWAAGPRLHCPISVLIGDADPLVTPDEARTWLDHAADDDGDGTGGTMRVFSGGHFYIDGRVTEVAAAIGEDLRQHIDKDNELTEGATIVGV
ncbi:thioesterase II family protein [Streptomyces violascens]|uniref:thioesterase II family protein n=1 Tax=Streptomyces violascens TaxID=67381 RepID=UPI0037B487B7